MKVVVVAVCLFLSNFLFSSQPVARLSDSFLSDTKLKLSGIFFRSFNPIDLVSSQSLETLSFASKINLGNVQAFCDIMRILRSQAKILEKNKEGSVSCGIETENFVDVFDIPCSQIFSLGEQERFFDQFSLSSSSRAQGQQFRSDAFGRPRTDSVGSSAVAGSDDDVVIISSCSSSFNWEELAQVNVKDVRRSSAELLSPLAKKTTDAAAVHQNPNPLGQPWYILVKNAVQEGSVEKLQWLRPKDPTYPDLCLFFRTGHKIQRKDPLFLICLAAQKKNINMIQSLLLMGFDKSTKDDHGKTALHYAIENEDLNMVEELLNNNSGFITHASMVYKYSSTGDTYLHIAARQGNKEIVKMLLDYCSDKNNFNYGLEASELHYNLDGTELNNMKQKAADVAYQQGHIDLVELLGGRTPSYCDCCSCVIQ
jgi:hypothetical protein